MAEPEKDDRLFAPFDIGMDEHPKIIGLSVRAFRALFEGTFYARRTMSDGFLDERVVLRRWGADAASELSANDVETPSWVRIESPRPGWRIHDFEKHHPLRAEIEAKRAALSEKRSRAGSKGAAKRWQANGKRMANDSSESESESETETQDLLLTESVSLGSNRARENDGLTDSEESTEQVEACLRLAAGHSLDLPRIKELAKNECGRIISHQAALMLGQYVTGKSKNRLKNPMSYVASAFKRSAAELQQWIDTEAMP